jgi:hypothetical protein
MTERPAEHFAALTDNYLADPTPENAQTLWSAALQLEGWFIILRGDPASPIPYCGSLDGRSFLAVWTDAETLNTYIDTAGLQPDEAGDIHYMMLPLPQAIDYILSFEEHGLDGIRFNLPKGWSVSFGTLRNIARFFSIG